MPDTPSTTTARAVVQGLVDAGVEHVVLCPGSRSAPLAYALHAASSAGLLSVHVRVDERSAGFTALGIGRATGPAAVVTTSGTAVANLLPAVWEAHHSRVPLLLLTADRPAGLRGTWANQTTPLQVDAFGAAVLLRIDIPVDIPVEVPVEVPVDVPVDVPGSHDLTGRVVAAVRRARGTAGEAAPGPVHLNLGFEDPLVPDQLAWEPARPPGPPWAAGPIPGATGPDAPLSTRPPSSARTPLGRGRRTVVVAGDAAGSAASELADSGAFPLLAEPSSAVGHSAAAVAAYRVLLDLPGLGGAVERVVVLGRPTLSRPVHRLLARAEVELVHVARPGEPGPDRPHNRVAAHAVTAVEPGAADDWSERWLVAGRRARRAVDDVLDGWGGLSGLHVARAVAADHTARAVDGPALFVGASSIIRDLDLMLDHSRPGSTVHASRGLSGIDGSLSTASGLALGRGTPVRALVGDLTFLHDANALLVGPTEVRGPVQVVVLNDRGGSIFGLLEHGQDRFAAVHERYFATPHDVDIEALCGAYGMPHRLVEDEAELVGALAGWDGGSEVVEVPVDRQRSRTLAAAVDDAARSGVLG